VRSLADEHPISRLCELMSVPRSSVYYSRSLTDEVDLSPLKELILTVRVTFQNAGVRLMYHYLASYYTRYTRAQVRQAYVELGLLRKPPPARPRTTDSTNTEHRFPNLVKKLPIERVNQVWVGDVTYVRVGSRFAYLATLMDACSRMIVGWGLSFSNDTNLVKGVLLRALRMGHPEIHHSDQGGPYGSKAYVRILTEHSVIISMAAVGKPEENGRAERLNRTLKEEEVRLSEYQTFDQAVQSIDHFILIYNTMRLHQALGYRTPIEIFDFESGTP
jgi:putative transposase